MPCGQRWSLGGQGGGLPLSLGFPWLQVQGCGMEGLERMWFNETFQEHPRRPRPGGP